MDFFKKHLEETLEVIKTFHNGIITVKRIRTAGKIKSSDRSKINFTWRALKSLVNINFLEVNGYRRPQSYKIRIPEKEINVDELISRVMKERKKIISLAHRHICLD